MPAPPTDDERRRNAALGAALAVKSALLFAQTVKGATPPNVPAVAADAAMSQGARPAEAAAIGVEIERLLRTLKPEDLPGDSVVGSIAAAAAAAAMNAFGAAAETAQQMTGPSTPVEPVKLYRALSQIHHWFPLGKLARELGLEDPGQLAGQLAPLVSDGYLRIENEHVWVTERGHRYLEVAPLT
jgi:hypothetical protein